MLTNKGYRFYLYPNKEQKVLRVSCFYNA
ncbi:helix-turn-helix domain-containing protein [Bacillus sp. 37MA]